MIKWIITISVTLSLIILSPLVCYSEEGYLGKERVAVMELRNRSKVKLREVRYLTNLIRQAASRLPQSKYMIMTTDNMKVMLPPGKKLSDCVGECPVEIARNIGAHWFVTGEVIKFGKDLRISLNLLRAESGAVRGTQTVKGKKLTDLEGPLQAAALYLFAEIDPSLKPQADRISGGFVFKKTILPEFTIKETKFDLRVKTPKSVEIPLPTFKASVFDQSTTGNNAMGGDELSALDQPLPMPKYKKDELGKVNFGNVDIEALQAYDEAVKGDQDESVAVKDKMKRWGKVMKVFKKKKGEAKRRIKMWRAYQRAEKKRLKLLARQELKMARLAKIRQQEEALEALYEEAVEESTLYQAG